MKKTGFTLIEVMVSLVIISLIVMFSVSVNLNSVRSVTNQKKTTQSFFTLRSEMEEIYQTAIDNARKYNKYKDDIHLPKNIVVPTRNVYKAFGVPISGYPLIARSSKKSSRVLYSFVSDRYQPILFPRIRDAWLDNIVRFRYLAAGDVNLKGDYSEVINKNMLYMVEHRWYATNKRKGMIDESNILTKPFTDEKDLPESELFKVEQNPEFKRDYHRLLGKEQTYKVIARDTAMRDKGICYSVIPLGLNKYVGIEVASNNTVYFIGLPRLNDLKAHYSADMILKYNRATKVALEPSNTNLKDWYDVRTYIQSMGNNNFLRFKNKELIYTPMGKAVKFSINKKKDEFIYNGDMTIFLRIKANGGDDNKFDSRFDILSRGDFDADGNLRMQLGKTGFKLYVDKGKLVAEKQRVEIVDGITYKIGVVKEPTILMKDVQNEGPYSGKVKGGDEDILPVEDIRRGYQMIGITLGTNTVNSVYHLKKDRTVDKRDINLSVTDGGNYAIGGGTKVGEESIEMTDVAVYSKLFTKEIIEEPNDGIIPYLFHKYLTEDESVNCF